MFNWIKENSTAFAVAVVLHLLFLGALLFNWQMDKPKKIVLEQGDIIQATSVDANSYEAEIRKIEEQKRAEKQRKAQTERKARELKEKKRRDEKRRQQEKKRKAEELKQKQAAEAKQKEEQRKAALLKEKQLKEKQLKEKQRKEAKKKAREAKSKKEEAKRKEDARKKAEQEKQRRLEEENKRQEAEKKRKAAEEEKRQAELKRKEARDKAERERRSKGIINRHVALIAQKIERSWRQPLDAPRKLQCKIDIVLLPSGNVVSVKVVESSGNQSFDRSVETAVRKASPLPVPTDSVIFKQFEVMRLRFEPGSH